MKNYINKAISALLSFSLILSIISTTNTAQAFDDSGDISLLWGSDKETEDEQTTPGFRD